MEDKANAEVLGGGEITFSNDGSEAYLCLITTDKTKSDYTVDDLKKRLQQAGVVNGIDEAELQKVIDDRMYNMPVKVAEGKKAVDGVDGWYEFLFQTEIDTKPKILEDGSVDYAGLGKNIDFQIENGTDAIIICGTTGESSTLDDKEHRECIRFAVEHTHNRIPVIAGTGSNDTKYAIELSQEAQELGADGLLIVTPYYNKTTQRGLVAHYNAIADSVNLPIILYNVPSRTGVGFDVNTVAALAEHKNIAAIKEASGNIGYTAKVAAKCGDKIDIYSGNDDMIVPIMSLGGKGVISVLSNVLPKETHQMTQYCLENNFAAAAEMQLKYLRLINDLFMEVNPIPVKDAMNQLGMPSGPCRMPLLDMSDEHKAAMQATLRAYGMIS